MIVTIKRNILVKVTLT